MIDYRYFTAAAVLASTVLLTTSVSAAPTHQTRSVVAAESSYEHQLLAWLQARLPISQWKGRVNVDGINVRFITETVSEGQFSPSAFSELVSASQIQTAKFRQRVQNYGAGIPVVGVRYGAQAGQPPSVQAATFVAGQSADGSVEVRIFDPSQSKLPLAADYTAPFALYVNFDSAAGTRARTGLFKPFESLGESGLLIPSVVQKNKIPVVFVHGLDSDPMTWADVANELQSYPDVRARYQFWFYRYPTGLPVPVTSMMLRESLQKVYSLYNPDGSNPNFNNMVIVGHSMGGILSRLQISDSGNQIWNDLAPRFPVLSSMLNRQDQLVQRTMFFSHQSFVSRAIFIGTPHQGSTMAGGSLARVASRMVKIPGDVLSLPNNSGGALSGVDLPTSIDSLTPTNPFVTSMQSLPIKVPYHSIMGDKSGQGKGTGSTDGVVAYWSSHLPGAQSELIVNSDHSVHSKPAAIQEIARILQQHTAYPKR